MLTARVSQIIAIGGCQNYSVTVIGCSLGMKGTAASEIPKPMGCTYGANFNA